MNIRDIAMAAALTSVFLTQSACVVHPTRALPAEYGAPDSLALLNSWTDSPAPGVIYELRTDSGTRILDMLGAKPLYEPAGWITRSPLERASLATIASRNIGDPLVKCAQLSWWQRVARKVPCDVPTPVTVELRVASSFSEVLLAPMSLVEILNRPVTGLAYNREAEAKIQLWRSSLASALYRGRGNGGPAVALCLAREQAVEATLNIVGRVDAQRAAALAVEVLAASSVRIDAASASEYIGEQYNTYTFRITSPLIVQATFRDVELVDGAIDTRIDFSLSGARLISAAASRAVESPPLRVGAAE